MGGETPLHIALSHIHDQVVTLLLQHGAEVNKANSNGDTPLHRAAIHGRVSVLKLLLQHGASVNTANDVIESIGYKQPCRR